MKKMLLTAIAVSAFAAPVASQAHEIAVPLPTGDTYYVDADSLELWQETNGDDGLQKQPHTHVDAEGNETVVPADTKVAP